MSKLIKDFFYTQNIEGNTLKYPAVRNLKITNALIQILGCGIFVVDYENGKILISSEIIAQMCGLTQEEIDTKSFDVYINHIPKDDYKMLTEVNNAYFKFIKRMSDEEILKSILSYNYHFDSLLMHQSFKPIYVENGVIKLGVFVITMSSDNVLGNVQLRSVDSHDYYEYCLDSGTWHYKEGIVLSSTEKLILLLSAQGRSTKNIGDEIHQTESNVKYCKKNLFKKMGVGNISEALICAINNRFF